MPFHLLEEVVRIPSPSYEEGALARHLAERLPAWGFATHVDEVGNLHAEIATTPLKRYLDAPNVGRSCPNAAALRRAFRCRVQRRQRRSDGRGHGGG